METYEDYGLRKAREVRVLQSIPLLNFPSLPKEVNDFVRDKLVVFHKCCINSAAVKFPETNWTGNNIFDVGDHQFAYGYQRFDLKVDAPAIYPNLPSELSPQTTYFTCSGMAALAAAFAALDRLLNKVVSFWSQSDAYFEAQHLARAYTRNLRPIVAVGFERLIREPLAAGISAILHVDSISARLDGLARAAADERVLMGLIDTTCFPRADVRITEHLNTFAQLGVPTLLVRSHLKLDSLGLECGRLGSLALYEPPNCIVEARPAVAGLRRLIPDVIRSFGLGAEAGNFFPLLDTAQFIELSSARARRTAENCELLAALLDPLLPDELQVQSYQHGQFLTIHHSAWTDAPPLKALIRDVVATCRAAGGAVVEANSFGFDFTVLSDVMDMTSNRFTVRIAPSDEPGERMMLLAASIASNLAAQGSKTIPLDGKVILAETKGG